MATPYEKPQNMEQSGFVLFGTFCARAGQIRERIDREGGEAHSLEVFEEALAGMHATREELLTLWVTLETALRATRKSAAAPEMPFMENPQEVQSRQ